jgi:hypothetical protein
VVVNVNQTNQVANISPGYVIRLPARAKLPAPAVTIEAED